MSNDRKILKARPGENGTLKLWLDLTNEDGVRLKDIGPEEQRQFLENATSAQWQLTDSLGAVKNNRSFANSEISPEGFILLTGADLAIPQGSDSLAVVGIEIKYASIYEVDLVITDEVVINIEDFITQGPAVP